MHEWFHSPKAPQIPSPIAKLNFLFEVSFIFLLNKTRQIHRKKKKQYMHRRLIKCENSKGGPSSSGDRGERGLQDLRRLERMPNDFQMNEPGDHTMA